MATRPKKAPDRPAESLSQAHAIISGRVQGIFYRASAKIEAQKRNLVGWVKNTPDGMVELVAQGPRSEVEDFLDWCRSGPMLAEVEEVKVTWQKPDSSFEGFEIKEYIAGLGHAIKTRLSN